ncbi:hypothetical protein R1T43_11830 [Alteromonas sp. CI.11.F.A3]|uniref:hypothetical protein n=1 Tax=Alteromonas sp. CI.11.F.A3 TaxID=3079555 RepID=UPI00294229FD|nr:hypothetical protein [Alteromonas sp. CI.11.F.A3]WOI35915.1 hypothetical protein R1T43_11830 [Alteromonas sp. CI.11.F.A3]
MTAQTSVNQNELALKTNKTFENNKTRVEDNAWFTQGWQLFKQAPFSLFVLMLSPLIIEGLLQLLAGPVALVLSKWMMVPVIGATWLCIHHLATKGKVWSFSAISNASWGKFLLISPLLLLPFLSQLMFSWLLLGSSGVDLLLFQQFIDISAHTLGLIFSSAVPLIMLLLFVAPLMLIAKRSFKQSMTTTFSIVSAQPTSIAILFALNTLVIYFAPHTFGLSVLLASPVLACIHYGAIKANLSQI